jgi:hypothetical protein
MNIMSTCDTHGASFQGNSLPSCYVAQHSAQRTAGIRAQFGASCAGVEFRQGGLPVRPTAAYAYRWAVLSLNLI